jgi:hypothetical protein
VSRRKGQTSFLTQGGPALSTTIVPLFVAGIAGHRFWPFQPRELDMTKRESLQGKGHHIYKPRFENCKSFELQKYLVGMPGFLGYARFNMAMNSET